MYQELSEQQKLKSALLTLAFIISFGTYFYYMMEGWGLVDSLYFTVSTVTTVGYGDLYPTTQVSKLSTVVFMISGVGLSFYSLNMLAQIQFKRNLTLFTRKRKKKI